MLEGEALGDEGADGGVVAEEVFEVGGVGQLAGGGVAEDVEQVLRVAELELHVVVVDHAADAVLEDPRQHVVELGLLGVEAEPVVAEQRDPVLDPAPAGLEVLGGGGEVVGEVVGEVFPDFGEARL